MASPVVSGTKKREHPSCAPMGSFVLTSGRQPGTRSIGRCVGTRACRPSRCRHKRRVFCRPLHVAICWSCLHLLSALASQHCPLAGFVALCHGQLKSPKLTGLRACLFPCRKRTAANDSSPKEVLTHQQIALQN